MVFIAELQLNYLIHYFTSYNIAYTFHFRATPRIVPVHNTEIIYAFVHACVRVRVREYGWVGGVATLLTASITPTEIVNIFYNVYKIPDPTVYTSTYIQPIQFTFLKSVIILLFSFFLYVKSDDFVIDIS